MPAAASIVVAMTIADWVTSEDPAVAVGATNGVQLSVPRSTSVSDVHCVVTPEDSMKSRNLGLILPKMSKATIHHVLASARQGNPPCGESPPCPVWPVCQPPDDGHPTGQCGGHGVDGTHQGDRHGR